MRAFTSPRILASLAALPLAAALSGCGADASATAPASPERAVGYVVAVLDQWKAGAPHGAPAGQPEPIRVADEEWLAGAKLIDFEPGEPRPAVGASVPVPVTLVVEGRRGKPSRKSVLYHVTDASGPMVIRQD